MKRRDLVKKLTALPFAGGFLPLAASANPADNVQPASGPLELGPSIYESIGVEPIINCRGTFTIIGGSVERPEVVAAMKAASGHFVQYDELAYGVGRRLAEVTGAEWGMVSSGCAAGMKHVTAACVTGGNPEKLIRIPDLTGFEKDEVIIPAYARNVYDHALRNIGVKIVTVNTAEELEHAINPRTALIYIMSGDESEPGQPLSLEVIASKAKPKNIPVLVDAAAEILTIPNVHLKQGATVVVYSGGKAICGPQCAGLVLGSKDLLMSAWQASSPHHGPGRDNKVGKEEMLGMLAAVEAWVKRDHQAEWKTWLSYTDYIAKQVSKIDGIKTSVEEPTGLSNRSPVLNISWDPDKLNITGEEVAEIFARNKPRIAIGGRSEKDKTSINITTGQMQPGNDKVVAERIVNLLSQKRPPRVTTLAAPGAKIGGHWDVTVEFFSSKSAHKLYIEQDGNWIQGSHTSDFSVQEVMGMVEGDQVKLRSSFRVPGDGITYMFSGTISGDAFSGSIYLGEYQTAKFTAKRSTYKAERRRVVIPGGPPLAT
ncbi:aminotransferase class V-fold PLP-dependent enzyme [Chryseolinea soli]|uniref:Aminotransferase class V-fold PLP-dependent enzyme n=1 Tax=Chryseolinea soli TaxID=2321403 RepID=A0A385SLS9_9BACT|nr:aminotransferase class V-fold PLP-dependent enzyme [Chryseolinea soli]AYB29968.1 aminotransferase class V-fold PLP-dependent enzyme [Chryseolinea soli]